jgi:hypothetical protein
LCDSDMHPPRSTHNDKRLSLCTPNLICYWEGLINNK